MDPIVAVVGATATGKSELALALAGALDGEIVGADASQLYRGMDIGTAKLTLPERRGIAHHQIDVLEVTQEATLAAYQHDSRSDLAAIRARGRRPMLVGGSGLYVRAALDVLDIPPQDAGVRARLEARLAEEGAQVLHDRLSAQDPDAARQILPTNARRVVRALEVLEITGRPFSASLPRREHVEPTVVIGLTVQRDRLDRRIAERTRRMWSRGLVEEVRALVPRGLREGRTAARAIGYRQALAQLDGALSQDEAVEQTAAATRRLVRRQESWFRPDPRILWLDAAAPDLLDRALQVVRHGMPDNVVHDR